LVGIIALLSISLIFLLFLKKNNKSAGNKSETATQEEIEDYKYSYEKLKKESKNLFDTNNFLKIQIQELKAYVKDLEDANVELVGQKEKLQDSKRQLEELQKQKDELFAIAVHDIKNPASIIKGLIELLTDYDLNAKDQQHIIQSLSETSNRIIDLAHNMAQVCARKKPEPEIMAEPGNIKEIIDSVCKRNMAYANNKGIKLINNTSFNIPKVSIDKSKMDEAIDNLVNNGIKYGPAGTIVQIKSFFNQTKITVEITDTGVGFSEEDMINVFQKGVTLSSEPTGGESRSGLGLWIVKKIIEDHGGRITLESKKGVGSKFIFELPIAKK
jgi:Signal transduction histidine kinase